MLDLVAERARAADVFETVEVADGLVKAHARVVESDCWYQVGPLLTVDRDATIWVGMYTPDRWLSGSIEADVLHMGDKYEDLIEEELVDQGGSGRLPVEHFRDDNKVFVFRSPVQLREDEALDSPALVERLTHTLLAYEMAFRELGDMVPEEE
jgi:hypothetical protein